MEYHKEKHSIDLLKANQFGIRLMLGITALSILLFYILWQDHFIELFKSLLPDEKVISVFFAFLKVILYLVFGIIAHELIHGIFWALFAKRGFHSIRFGILKKYFTPYCHCKEPLRVKHYITGAVMPAILLGLVPLIYAFIFGKPGWLLFGIFFTASAAGDFLMIRLLSKEARNDWAQDHPAEAGYYIFRKIDESNP